MVNTKYIYCAVIVFIILLLIYYFVSSDKPAPITNGNDDKNTQKTASYYIYYNRLTIIPNVGIMNDGENTRIFKYSGNKDGILYETTPYAGAFQYALLVAPVSIGDYYSALQTFQTKTNILHPEITTTTIPYIGIFVSATNNVIDKDITYDSANTTNWLGICDLTILLAKLIASGTQISDIGTYSGTLPTVKGQIVPSSYLTTTTPSIVTFPQLVNNSPGFTETFGISSLTGIGLSISADGGSTFIYDSQYYQNNKATSIPFPDTQFINQMLNN